MWTERERTMSLLTANQPCSCFSDSIRRGHAHGMVVTVSLTCQPEGGGTPIQVRLYPRIDIKAHVSGTWRGQTVFIGSNGIAFVG